MSDPYTDLLAQPSAATGAAGGDPYGALLGVDDQRQRFKSTLNLAVGVAPDQAAQQRNIAKQLQTPVAAVEALPDEAKRAAAVQTVEVNTAKAPVLRKKYTEADFAKLAHDDSGVLSGIEATLGQTARYLVSADDDKGLVNDLTASYYRAGSGTSGLFRAATELTAPLLDFLEADPSKGTGDWRVAIGGNPLRRLAEGFDAIAQDSNRRADAAGSKFEGDFGRGVASGVQSLGQNLLMLPAALLTGGESAVLTGMAAMTGGGSYQKARKAGVNPYTSALYGASDAVVEYATEKLPMHKLLGDLKAGTPFFQTLVRNAALEIPGEQIATLLQDANEWAVLHPEKSVNDYLRERPSAALQTLIATLVGSGGQVTLMRAVQQAANNVNGQVQLAHEAEQFGRQLEALFGLAAESKLRERAPDTFAAVVQQMADETGGAPSAVYIDARTLGEVLSQSGMTPEQLNELLPNTVSQLQDAIAQNGTVAIPTGELLAAAPGTPLEQGLLPHLRSSPEALSQMEAQEAGKQAGEFIKSEAERVMQQAADRQAIEQSADAVRTTILDQLNQTKRFRPEANAVYADMVRAFYATMAQRTGVTPEELYAKYPLRVAAEGAGGLAQGAAPDTPEFKAWFGDSKVVDAEGKPLVVYHGTGGDFSAFDPNRVGENYEKGDERGFFFTDKPVEAEWAATRGAEVSGGAANVMPVYLSLENPLVVDVPPSAEVRGLGDPSSYYDNHTDEILLAAEQGDHDGVIVRNAERGYATYIAFEPTQIKSAIGNRGTYDLNSPNILGQPGTRATFSPEQMLIVLGQNADLSSFLHESGHFFLEVLADLGTQPGAPEQIAKDWQTTLEWFGLTAEQWAGMTLDQKRPYHERWAESVEQYFFEGKAPSVELRGVFDRFRTWLTSVYKSLKRFLAMRELTPGGQASAVGTGELAQSPTDQERADAEALAVSLGAKAADVSAMTDDQLRITLFHLRNPRAAEPPAKKKTLAKLTKRTGLDADGLSEKYGIAVADDGLVEVDRVTEANIKVIGDLPVAFFHHTSTALLDAIKKEGLRVGKQTNFFNTQAGVYVTTIRGGTPVTTYGSRAAKVHGGEPTTLRIARRLSEVTPDPDDADLAWAQGKQFITPGVPPSDLRLDGTLAQSDAPAAAADPLGLSDEVRAVMDRLLATDEQIAEAERVRRYGLLFKSPEEAGMTPEQWAKYISDDEKAHAEALNELGKKSLKNLGIVMRKRMRALREVQADMAEKRKAVEAEAAEQIAKEPVYQAMRWLKKGEMTTAEGEEIKVTDGFKLDAAAVNAIFPESMPGRPDLAKLKGMMRKTDGMDPSIVAEMFGFRDAAHLITSIVEAFPQADQVQGLTDQMMLERYGDAATPRGMERAADEAVHNENRARVLAAEMAAVNRANDARAAGTNGRTVNAMVEAAKQFAENLVGRKLIKDLKPNVHTAAETRAARAAEKALAKGDTQGVIQAKRDQLLNFHAARATNEARIEAAKITAFFKKVATAKDDAVGKTRDIDVVKAAQAILAAYDIGTKGKAAAEYLAVLERNDPAMFAAVKPSIDTALINAKPIDQLTMAELRALNEEVQALWYLAKRSRQMEIDGNLLDRQEVEDDLKARMLEIGIPDSMPGETSAITPAEQRALKLKHYLAMARRVESWARGLDGSKGLGPFTRYVWQPVKEAANAYRTDKAKYLKAFRDLLKAVEPTLTKRQIEAPELNYTFGKDTDGVAMAEMLHALLHTGNESNKRKLLLGRKWATENADGTLDTRRWDAFVQRMVNEGILQPVHFDFAQGVWDLLEQTKPLAQKAHRDVFGRYFAEVTADEFVDPFGTKRRGGYVPAQADARIVSDAATRALAEAENASMQFAFPTTNKGFTKGRVEYNRPLMLDLRGLAQHIDKVLLFSHMEQPVRDVRKVLTAKGVAYGLNRIDPAAFDTVLTPWLNRAAKQLVATPAPNNWQGWRFWTTLRNRAGMAAMFGNIANAVQQFAGFSLAAVRVKPSALMSATAQYVANPKQTAEMVASKSQYMDGRLANEVANMNDAINEILINPTVLQSAQRFTTKHAYFLQSAIDNVMGPIIWTGAYNQALAEGMTERDAIRKADAAVRETQGATAPEDISAFEEGTPFSRLFTQFAGYFNMQANLLGTEFQTLAREMGLRKGVGRGLYVLTFGFLVNAWVAEAIMQLFKGGPDDDDKDGEFLDDWLKQVFGWSLFRNATAMIPLAGQGLNSLVNATNDKPYDDRMATSPAISMLEAAAKAPTSVYKAIVEDGKVSKAVKDVGTLIALTVGIPLAPVTKPLGYVADVEQGKVSPTGPVDAVRGAVTGAPSGPSKNR